MAQCFRWSFFSFLGGVLDISNDISALYQTKICRYLEKRMAFHDLSSSLLASEH